MRQAGRIFFVWGMLGLTACRATVAGDPNRPIKIEAHITVDVRQVKETATSIEDMVSGTSSKASPKNSSRLEDWIIPSAWADALQLKFMTPQVQKAVDSRRDRFDQLKAAKAQGFVGEDNQGHVVALGGGPDTQSLIETENKDREIIYRTIVEQNQLAPDAIGTIRSTFAEVQREKAESGEKVQLPSGDWITK